MLKELLIVEGCLLFGSLIGLCIGLKIINYRSTVNYST